MCSVKFSIFINDFFWNFSQFENKIYSVTFIWQIFRIGTHTNITKTRGKGKDWVFIQKFYDVETAEIHLSKIANVSKTYNHQISCGTKFYFHCQILACEVQYQIFHSTTATNLLQYSEHHHTDENVLKTKILKRIPKETKEKIREYRQMKFKPKAILSALCKNNPELPASTLAQLYSFNAREDKEITKISMGELESWLVERSSVPDNEHTSFAVHYELNYETPEFRFLLTTRNLLQQSMKSKILHADTTYKLKGKYYCDLYLIKIDHKIFLITKSNKIEWRTIKFWSLKN